MNALLVFVASAGLGACLVWMLQTLRRTLERLADERKMLNEIVHQRLQLDAKIEAWRTDTVECIRLVLAPIPGPLKATAAAEMLAVARENRMTPEQRKVMEEAIQMSLTSPADPPHGVN